MRSGNRTELTLMWKKVAYTLCEREKAACILYWKKNEPCLLVEPGKWWRELEGSNTHMLTHVLTSKCMHTGCRHIGMT